MFLVQLFSLLLSTTFLCSSGDEPLLNKVVAASKPLEEGVAVGSCDVEGVLGDVVSCLASLFSRWLMSVLRPGEFSSRSPSEPVDVFSVYLPDLYTNTLHCICLNSGFKKNSYLDSFNYRNLDRFGIVFVLC